MNIPSASATPSSAIVDAPTRAASLDPATDTPPVADPSAPGGPVGFGTLLARQIDLGGADDRAPADLRAPVGGDAVPVVTLSSAEPVVDAARDPAAFVASSADPLAVSKRDAGAAAAPATDDPHDAVEDTDDVAANGLAAQIALASQWAALASPPAAGKTAPPPSGGEPDRDVKGKLDAIRQAAASGSVAMAPASPDAIADGKPLPVAMPPNTAPQDMRPGTRTPQAAAHLGSGETETIVATAGASNASPSNDPSLVPPVSVTDHRAALAAQPFVEALAQVAGQNGPMAVTHAGPSAAGAPALPLTALHATVGTPAWSQEVGQATLRVAASELQAASLRLNPEHLGPVDVQIRIDNGVANVTFTAAHAETRHALEASRTTLDQMFGDQGIKLGQCAVGDGSSSRGFDASGAQADASRRGPNGRDRGDADSEARAGTSTVTTRLPRALGLVDTFA